MMLDCLLNHCEQARKKEGGEFMAKLQIAAEKGDPFSEFAYGYLLYLRNPLWSEGSRNGMQWMRKAARGGDPEMLLFLADLLCAEPGVTQGKLREIHSLHYRGRNSGNARLQNRLGILYLAGIGCCQDIRKGRRWIEKAAMQGYPPAVANMMELESVISDTAVQEKLACGSVGLYTERIHDLLSPEEWDRNLMKMLE